MPRNREQYNTYMAAYMKTWYDRRHAEAIEKLGGKCAQCGVTGQLEFDHIDPATKAMTIAKMWTASETRFQAELKKCQILCRPCHVLKILTDRGMKPAKGTHGTLSAYRWCGPPKCEECKRAKREYAHTRSERLRARSSAGRAGDS